MGCDGGTIPKRNEIVKNKQRDQVRDKNADLLARYQFCALSGIRLKRPIVSCQLGRLYNKDAILEYLLELKTVGKDARSSDPSRSIVSHIKSLKDVRTLNLKEKDDFDKHHQATSSGDSARAQYTCPITGLDLNGKYKFYYIYSCGCVFSERALKELSSKTRCILCSKSYDLESDLIDINGDDSEIQRLREKLSARRRRQREAKIRSDHEKTEATSAPTATAPDLNTCQSKRDREDKHRHRDGESSKRHKSGATTMKVK